MKFPHTKTQGDCVVVFASKKILKKKKIKT